MILFSSAATNTQLLFWEGRAQTRTGHVASDAMTKVRVGRCMVVLVSERELWHGTMERHFRETLKKTCVSMCQVLASYKGAIGTVKRPETLAVDADMK